MEYIPARGSRAGILEALNKAHCGPGFMNEEPGKYRATFFTGGGWKSCTTES